MWTLEQKEYLSAVRFGEASSIVMASMASAFLAVGIFVDSSIWRGFVTCDGVNFNGVSFFSGRNICRQFDLERLRHFRWRQLF